MTDDSLAELPSIERPPAREGGPLGGLYTPRKGAGPEERYLLGLKRQTPRELTGPKMTAAMRDARDATVQMTKANERRFKASQLMQRFKNQLGLAQFNRETQAKVINKTKELVADMDPMVVFDVVKNQFGGNWDLGMGAVYDRVFDQVYRAAGGGRRRAGRRGGGRNALRGLRCTSPDGFRARRGQPGRAPHR